MKYSSNCLNFLCNINKFQLIILVIIMIIIIISSHLGEIIKNYVTQENTCDKKIDIVYTWVNGSDKRFRQNLDKFLIKDVHKINDYSAERFDDKYELKFSLRSLEKFAPWVNHVYIVTNGQIPYWLNLDYEKVTVVPHENIFKDLDILPTFSSPAIESNIHRIPGLSDRFIYFNDDIFLGAHVYPADFFTSNRGFLVYLAWALPSCVPNCPWIYVGDGQCDNSCYNSDCQYDGGDCEASENRLHSHHLNHDFENEELKNDFDYEYYEEENPESYIKRQIFPRTPEKLNITENRTIKNISTNKILLGAVVITKDEQETNKNVISMTTGLKTNKIDLLLGNRTKKNVLNLVNEHNQKFISNDKIKRKKRLFRTLRKRERFFKKIFNVTNNNYTEKINRQNLDTYALSLQHSNRVFNLNYGYKIRKVPAHAPILIDKNVMNNLQIKFEKEILTTQKNRFRSQNDLQFSFTYYYYLMNEKKIINVSEIFDNFDTDDSGTWSDREIRTILTKINELPLNYGMVEIFDNAIINCSKHLQNIEVTVPPFERYIDSKLPTVTKYLVLNCPSIINMLTPYFGVRQKYPFEIIKNSQGQYVMFKMLTSNISDVVGHLDEIRKEPRKFICLNDNMNPKKTEDNELVKAILLDFYISLFPKPSRFELPAEFRNRFSYIDDLENWKMYHTKLKIFLMFCVIILFGICLYNICKRRLIRQIKKIIYF